MFKCMTRSNLRKEGRFCFTRQGNAVYPGGEMCVNRLHCICSQEVYRKLGSGYENLKACSQ